ncbi:L-dopachrome tautomerase-related protein [Haliangium sp.]|uniref:L-dopachrome tautomerase-related protein n=1 Tax=Haliangium sp. TaxID=2663208 RepID=UPI003D148CE4
MWQATIQSSWACTCAALALAWVAPGCGSTAQSTSSAASTSASTGDEVSTGAELVDLVVLNELQQGPGNITVTPDGRVFVSQHQFYEPEVPVVLVKADGEVVPIITDGALDAVLGIQSDDEGVVWMLDNGLRSGTEPQLLAWDSRDGQRLMFIDLGEVTAKDSFVNDLVVDDTHRSLYIADPAGGSNAAIIVVDFEEQLARRVLEGHESVVPEDVDLVIDGTPVRIRQPDGSELAPRVGINPIAADADNEWLYYGPMHGHSMYRVRTSDLRDPTLSAEELAARVERWADKPICDGISIDTAGNIYISDLAANAIGVIDAERNYRVLVSDPRLSWPDAFSYGPDGRMYVVANQLHRSATLNAGTDASKPPYRVLTFKPLAPGVVGR